MIPPAEGPIVPAESLGLVLPLALSVAVLVGAAVWARLAPRLVRLADACAKRELPVPARVRSLVGRVGAAYVAARCRWSAAYFAAWCLRQAGREVHGGLTAYEEWAREAASLPAAARAAIRSQLRRYAPSAEKVASARARVGRPRLVFRVAKSR